MPGALPPLPIPEPLRGAEIGSFAHDTLVRRLPEIGRRTLAENYNDSERRFHPQSVARWRALLKDLPDGSIRLLDDPGAPDEAAWNGYLAPYIGLSWLQIPWFLAETYFFRSLLAASGYFQPGPGFGLDPNAYQKQQGLILYHDAIRRACRQAERWLYRAAISCDLLAELFQFDLWGNQADLSLWPADEQERPDRGQQDPERSHYLLCDDSRLAAECLLQSAGGARVDFLLDNAGAELVNDLLTANCLLACGIVRQVIFHLKPHPTYVSDATIADVLLTLNFMRSLSTPSRSAAEHLQAHLEQGRLVLQDDYFWTSPLAFWEAPAELRRTLSAATLLISKGDANYRRLLGDRHWPVTTSFAQALSYTPAPLLALRVSKSDVIVGLPAGRAEQLDLEEPLWRYSGRWGMIQFASGEQQLPTDGIDPAG